MCSRFNKIFKILLFSVAIGGCSIIFEEDISGEIVYVIMPADGTLTDLQEQLFWWERIDGVIQYNLQIVNGRFSDPYALVVDTNVTGDKFQIDLIPGDYEWRIQGWNNYSETDYFYSLLTIADTTTVYEE